MFDAIGGLPLHPLLIHAPVIGIPLAFLLACLFAVPRTRSWARWPLAVTTVGVAGATIAAKLSGDALRANREIVPGNPTGDLIARHAALGNQLVWIVVTVAVLGVLAAVVAPRRGGGVGALLTVLVLLGCGVALVWVVRVGDLGARAVWNPAGNVDYSATR